MYALGEYRSRIIQIAKAESNLMVKPYGKVTDFLTQYDGKEYFRYGWPTLKNYFDVAVIGWGWQWNDTTLRSYIKDGAEQGPITYLDGVKKRYMRVPQDAAGNGMHWCGIFATWVLIQAFRSADAARWRGPGIIGRGVSYVDGNKGVQPGDVVVFGGKLVHHCIVYDMDESAGKLWTINGNSDGQSILWKEMKLKEVKAYYQVNDEYTPMY